MKKYGIQVGLLTLLAALAVSGCSEPTLYQKAGDTATYRDNKTDGTVFVTATYDNPDDKPSFDDIFRVHADTGYVGDIDDTQYADTRLQTGRHVINVELIDWTGYSINTATAVVNLAPGQTVYVEERVHGGDAKPTLSIVDAAQGAKNIVTRKRICNCGNMLGIEF